ncbi:hypothetical protein B0H34DRAFT_694213 [Crassisporium funariophilum]|nr:hypothetical protein B0H34DRAFT_694213 [Crassisporium funariophilum]
MATTASLPAYLLPGVQVHQPPHLEGDPSLATEILPGPPSLVSAQQAAQKRDPRKPSLVYSYLPTSDPGSTYSGLMHGTLIGQDSEGPRSKRSRLDKGTATGRAQRASARNQAGTTSSLDPPMYLDAGTSSASQPTMIEPDQATMVIDDEPSISRSNSSQNLQDTAPPITSGKPKRRDKGKEKEVDTPPLRVKEEPKAFSLNSPEPPHNLLNNEDHCSSCRSYGALVYCDGCPRAFHLWCLDPPMEGVEDGEARWFCPSCVARKDPPSKPPSSLLSPLIHNIKVSIPVEFQLPEDIRTFFKDVTSGPKGNYVDSSEIKPPRLNRHGQLEDRDPYRLRDKNGEPVLCFQCGMSALPASLAATAPAAKRARRSTSKAAQPDAWKSIVSCDYCSLHWHLDCLEPPLPTLPPFNKKWMCPNHAERVLPPKRRVPRNNALPIEITKPRQYNNGNIDVIHPEFPPTIRRAAVPIDEVTINGRRYRVPERVIVLDFWNKLNKWDEHVHKDMDITSGMSSPLTSLSSLDDSDERMLSASASSIPELDELSAAQILCSFASARANPIFTAHHRPRKLVDHGVQTSVEAPNPNPTPSVKNKVGRPRKHPVSRSAPNGAVSQAVNRLSESTSTTTGLTISTVRRRRAAQHAPPEASTRELRSRSKNTNIETPLTSVSSRSSFKHAEDNSKDGFPFNESVSAPPPSLQIKAKAFNVKLEEVDNHQLLMSGSFAEPTLASSSGTSKTPRATRIPRQAKQKDVEVPRKDTKERRGRKRKLRDDELPGAGGENGIEANTPQVAVKKGKESKSDKGERDTRKITRTPARQGQLHAPILETTSASSTMPIISPSLPVTPSLKIRLPRLSNLNISSSAATLSSANLDTPTRRH